MSKRTSAAAVILFSLVVCVRSGVAGDATLTVRTAPEGLEVWLGDSYLGDSPIVDKRVKPGRYSLKIVDAVRHTSVVEQIFLQEDENKIIDKTVEGKYGTLRIGTDPQGAEVSIATSLGTTPLSNEFMVPGKYRLEVRHPNKLYQPTTEEVVVPRGETVTLNRELERTTPFTTKALARLLLGAGAAAGFVVAIVEQGKYREYLEKAESEPAEYDAHIEASETAAVWRTLGIVVGAACVVGFEVVAFF